MQTKQNFVTHANTQAFTTNNSYLNLIKKIKHTKKVYVSHFVTKYS